jgi:hypothetical protein
MAKKKTTEKLMSCLFKKCNNVGTILNAKMVSHSKKKTRLGFACRDCNLKRLKKWMKNNPRGMSEIVARSIKKYPEKQRARAKLNNAIKLGKIKRPKKCSDCGTKDVPIHAHHDNYDNPFEVKWLCRLCHCKLHKLEKLMYNSKL